MNDTKSTPDINTPHGRLRRARMRAGFGSAEKAAEALGVLPTTYRSHENGSRKFFLEAANAYGAAFNVEPDYLLNGETDNQNRGRRYPREGLLAVMTEGARIAQISALPPEYLADMMLEALEALADESAGVEPREFARIHLGALKRRSAAR